VGVAIVLFGISVATAPGFSQLIATPYNQVSDYAFGLEHADCGIVIYGDSSSITSDDPATIEAQTSLKTCNIAQTQPVVDVAGTLPIDLYLKKNRVPKYLVLQLAPEAFYQPHRLDETAAFDPMTVMLRHNRGAATTRELLRYPVQTLRYVSLALQARYHPNTANLEEFRRLFSQPIADYYKSRGLMTLPYGGQGGCQGDRVLPDAVDFGWVEEARRRYSAMGVTVVVMASPIPECDPMLERYRRELGAHVSGGVTTMPISYFNDSDRHFTREGAMLVSRSVGEKIKNLERQHSGE
jgi:hypothetical protein